MFTANGWATATLVLLGIFLLFLFLYLTARTSGGKKATFFLGIIAVLLLICSGIIALQKYINEAMSHTVQGHLRRMGYSDEF